MARTERVLVRLTTQEKAKLQAYADKLGVSMSEIIQDWINALPEPQKDSFTVG